MIIRMFTQSLSDIEENQEKRVNKTELAYTESDAEYFRPRPKIRIQLPGVDMYALVDTGASMTCLRSDFARSVLQAQGRPYTLMKHVRG